MRPALKLLVHGLGFVVTAVVLAGVATVGCARMSTVAPRTARPAPFLALRLAFNDSALGRERARYGDTTFFLAPDVLLSDEDVLSVSSVVRPVGGLLLHVRYRPEAAHALRTATARHVGDRMAVLLDSRVWVVAPIAGAIGGAGDLLIATGATGDDAERIALQIRSRWPAR